MKDSLLFGVIIGIGIGALLFKHSPVAKDIINKSEDAIKKEINSMAKETAKKTSTNAK